MPDNSQMSLVNHIKKVNSGERRFENIYRSLSRLILEDDIAISDLTRLFV